MWIGGLSALKRPFLHLHTQFNRDLPWARIDMDFMNLNQSAHGDREAGFLHTRLRLNRKVVVGHWSDPDVQEQIATWMAAARAWHDWQGAKFCRFGDNMRQVGVTEGDKVAAEAKLGYAVNGYGAGDLATSINAVGDKAVDSLCDEYEQLYTVAKELQKVRRVTNHFVMARALNWLACLLESGQLQGLHDHIRRLTRPETTARPRCPAPDGRGLWVRRGRRLENLRVASRDESHGRRAQGRHVIHGGLHLSPQPRRSSRPRRAHARNLRIHRCRANRR